MFNEAVTTPYIPDKTGSHMHDQVHDKHISITFTWQTYDKQNQNLINRLD